MAFIRPRITTALVASLMAAGALTLGASPASSEEPSPKASASSSQAPEQKTWKLAWSDEFNGTKVDESKWNVYNKSTYGDGNGELACLMNRPENVKVTGGQLRITAQKEKAPFKCNNNDERFKEAGGRSYTSGHLHTKNKAAFTYGRIEMRAKLPTAAGKSKGLWPALWMRPTDGGWGELDILEALGSNDKNKAEATKVHHTIHHSYKPNRVHPPQGTSHVFTSGSPSDGMHTYAVEWEKGAIRWYVDNKLTYTRDLKTTPWLSPTFDKEFFIRLNLAVGGGWPGSPDDSTVFPATYAVDYVRVYQRG